MTVQEPTYADLDALLDEREQVLRTLEDLNTRIEDLVKALGEANPLDDE